MTFRYSATLGGFDDTPLTDFARDKELIACREHFYVVNEVPHVTCVVIYQDAVVPQAALAAAREIAPRPAASALTHGGPAGAVRRRDGAPNPCTRSSAPIPVRMSIERRGYLRHPLIETKFGPGACCLGPSLPLAQNFSPT